MEFRWDLDGIWMEYGWNMDDIWMNTENVMDNSFLKKWSPLLIQPVE